MSSGPELWDDRLAEARRVAEQRRVAAKAAAAAAAAAGPAASLSSREPAWDPVLAALQEYGGNGGGPWVGRCRLTLANPR